jgi:YVTN family beta-propeller protein
VSADGTRLFVPIFSSNHIEVLDTQRRSLLAKVPVGYGPHGTFLSANGKSVYAGTIHQQQITVFDAATHKVLKTIPMTEGVRPFAISKDETRLYAQLSRLHGFVVVDLATDKIVRTVELPDRDKVPTPGQWPYTVNHGLGLTPDEKLLFAAATRSDFIAVYSHPGLELQGTVPVGGEPNWLIFSPDGRYCYVSNRKSNDVSVIDVATLKEVARIKVGNYPQRLATVKVK